MCFRNSSQKHKNMSTSKRYKRKSTLSENATKNFLKGILIISLCLITQSLFAQVGIGNTDPKATLDITVADPNNPLTTDGILVPRVNTLTFTGLTADQNGMLVYLTTDVTISTVLYPKGFYYWDQSTTSWTAINNGNKNTLDQAYDEGGAGAGRVIDAIDGAVRINGEDGFLVTGTSGSGNTIDTEVTGSGTRMFFNPRKGAFRAGEIDNSEWNNSNIGVNSFAAGNSTTASGDYSTALGFYSQATAIYSTSIGFSANAIGTNSIAIGTGILASGDFSLATGYFTDATANYSTAFGYETLASGDTSTAMGFQTSASGSYATAMGNNTSASGENSTAMGFASTATGDYSLALGYTANASGEFSTAIGLTSTASGDHSTALGNNTNASGDYSTAMGFSVAASGDYSTAMGRSNSATGENSTVMGIATNAPSYAETSFGTFSNTYTPISATTFTNNDKLFNIGNGTSFASRSNALTIYKNGLMNINDEYNMPLTDGTANQVMATNGAGVVSFADASAIFTDSDNQNLILSGTTLSIQNGNSINLSALEDNDWYRSNTTNAPTSINNNIFTQGSVGIGFNNPSYALDVRDSNSAYITQIYNTSTSSGADGLKIRLGTTSLSSSNYFIGFFDGNGTNGTIRGRIQGSSGAFGTGVSYNTTSDRRLKTNIKDINNALILIDNIQPRLYEYKAHLGTQEYGFIAQELQPIYPQAVSGSPDSDVTKNPMMVDYGRLTPLLAAGIKELKEEVNTLKTENATLKAKLEKLESLESRLTALESKAIGTEENTVTSKED